MRFYLKISVSANRKSMDKTLIFLKANAISWLSKSLLIVNLWLGYLAFCSEFPRLLLHYFAFGSATSQVRLIKTLNIRILLGNSTLYPYSGHMTRLRFSYVVGSYDSPSTRLPRGCQARTGT